VSVARWQEVARSAPEFADAARELFDAHHHKTIATLRRGGAPRISGIEATFKDGDLWLGMMPGSLKARDLQRDGRMALHSASVDPDDDNPSGWPGDAKISGWAEEITDEDTLERFGALPDGSHLFRVEVEEVVTTRVGDPADHLVIELWRVGQELKRMTRT
jgi:Pyridoxamine 5'-phosphate oxidase